MLILPRFRWAARLPAALIGIGIVTVLVSTLGWPVAQIGTIPATLIFPDRYLPTRDDLALISPLLGPAVAIAAIGAIESLLAGSWRGGWPARS